MRRPYSAGIVALRPEATARSPATAASTRCSAATAQWVIDAHFPPAGHHTQPVEAGYMANAYVRMRHPDYDTLRGMLDDVGAHHPRPRRLSARPLMRTILLGPQRFMTTAGTALRSLGVDGPVATINAGWEEREDVVDELDTVLERPGQPPAALPPRVRRHREGRRVRRRRRSRSATATTRSCRSTGCARTTPWRACTTVPHRTRRGRRARARAPAVTAFGAVDDAVEGVGTSTPGMRRSSRRLYAEPTRGTAGLQRCIAWHRGEIARLLADCAALVLTGGHVGTLLRALRLFAIRIPDECR